MATLTVDQISKMLDDNRQEFDLYNTGGLNFDHEKSFALQTFKGSDYLRGMNPETIAKCLVRLATTGLTLNPVLKYSYLVPRQKECKLDPSYMGLIKIITDSGSAVSVKAGIIYENEEWDIDQGSSPYVKHKPIRDPDVKPGRCVLVYSIATLHNGSHHVEVMYFDDIEKIKLRSDGFKATHSPWKSDWGEMAKKTVVKRQWKYLPKTERAILAANAIAMDDETNETHASTSASTTQAPQGTTVTQSEFCTQADFESLNTLLNSPYLGEFVFTGTQAPILKEMFRDNMDVLIANGGLPKERYTKAKEILKAEIKHYAEQARLQNNNTQGYHQDDI